MSNTYSEALKQLPELKPIKLYLDRSSELKEQKPIISYFCKLYAAQKGAASKSLSEEAKTFLLTLMDELDAEKKNLAEETAIKSKDEGYEMVYQFADRIFVNCDSEDRSGVATKRTAHSYVAAKTFFEILDQFLDADADDKDPAVQEKIKYAAWRAAEISKAINQGLNPPLPPSVTQQDSSADLSEPEDFGDTEYQEGTNMDVEDDATSAQQKPSASPDERPNASVPNGYDEPPANDNGESTRLSSQEHMKLKASMNSVSLESGTESDEESEDLLDPLLVDSVIKHCRFTISAMQYEDLETARKNLEDALVVIDKLEKVSR